MENRIDDFNKQLIILIENIRSEVKYIEMTELEIPTGSVSPLGQILSEIFIPNIEINSMLEISDSRVEKGKVISYLVYEMRFLNSKHPHSDDNKIKMKSNKWLKSVGVVLESIANYFKIPYWDIIQEVTKLASIIVGADSSLNGKRA